MTSGALGTTKGHVTRPAIADLAGCADAEAEWQVHRLHTDACEAAVRTLLCLSWP